ncbi:ABC transporter permease [Photorhabdus laumondii]|uniref:ABC transporter permease n=1 Tax=Photorhabdus laumondii TaxID=2218628 RepID=UPI0033162836
MSSPTQHAPQQAVRFSWWRLKALCIKETKQILRDPTSGLISIVIPLILLFIFGYGINLDSSTVRLGILVEQQSEDARELIQAFAGSPYIEPKISDNRQQLINMMQSGEIRGLVVIPVNFDAQLARPDGKAQIQVITDGSEPNTASFVQNYAKGVWQIWLQQRGQDQGNAVNPLIDMQVRYWFNPATISQHFIIPGAITIIITVVGAILTSLVVAREWERGTMEALLSTQITRTELLLSKLLPYQVLGSFSMLLCMLVAIFVLDVPYRGSLWILSAITSLYLATALGIGLLISTVTRNQFNAAMIALNVAFLPAIMLSGFIFEINSMPAFIQVVTYFIPTRYFVSSLHTLFLAGNISTVLVINLLLLIASAIVFIGLTAWKTQRRLD